VITRIIDCHLPCRVDTHREKTTGIAIKEIVVTMTMIGETVAAAGAIMTKTKGVVTVNTIEIANL
jgi:DNA replicative helicase MCM subunit Mcm2 (Cdc46/Mcm family)